VRHAPKKADHWLIRNSAQRSLCAPGGSRHPLSGESVWGAPPTRPPPSPQAPGTLFASPDVSDRCRGGSPPQGPPPFGVRNRQSRKCNLPPNDTGRSPFDELLHLISSSHEPERATSYEEVFPAHTCVPGMSFLGEQGHERASGPNTPELNRSKGGPRGPASRIDGGPETRSRGARPHPSNTLRNPSLVASERSRSPSGRGKLADGDGPPFFSLPARLSPSKQKTRLRVANPRPRMAKAFSLCRSGGGTEGRAERVCTRSGEGSCDKGPHRPARQQPRPTQGLARTTKKYRFFSSPK